MRKKKDFIVFGSPLVGEEEIKEVVDCLRSGWLGTGPKVARFESNFEVYKGGGHAVAVNSCTAALHLSLLASGLKPGDEVITSAMTFCATVNAIIHAGAKPVIADIDPVTFNISLEKIKALIGKRTRVILPVHFAGRPCEMDAIMELADQHGLLVIEDCAHAVEAEYKGTKTGRFGRFGCFSFYVTKNVITGEGGMVLATTKKDAARIKTLALHGMSKDAWKRFSDEGYIHYQVVDCGYKYNMMDIQAAIGIHQLERVDANWQRRRQIWRQYDEAFADLPITTPAPQQSNTRHAYHLYTILVDSRRTGISRDKFLQAMNKKNIGVGVHYLSIPEHEYYKKFYGWKPEYYPEAMRIGRQTVSLPLSAKLNDNDVGEIIEGVRDTLK
ncbi:MAG: DegT/DnrJ/EryC1/StrS family aminotransferase [Candidatus Glassbacteria bacterium]